MFQILISSSPTTPPGIEEDEQVSHEQVFEYILYSQSQEGASNVA